MTVVFGGMVFHFADDELRSLRDAFERQSIRPVCRLQMGTTSEALQTSASLPAEIETRHHNQQPCFLQGIARQDLEVWCFGLSVKNILSRYYPHLVEDKYEEPDDDEYTSPENDEHENGNYERLVTVQVARFLSCRACLEIKTW